ncbi:MAG: indolepyruvate oxidoreductase subunit beta [Christensenellaceae bacterium]|jgi:indolepyruvate ferredoxin oxidoreductase beta subunit|nr:indolepyruvate oxidoreductase subunit beta [Christensenellaceae bacterium]
MVNILIAGVGGQGTLVASRILGNYAVLRGMDCKLSEIHGMSQRGGSVVTHVRMGQDIASPVISEGEADYILAFETLEALRWQHYLKADGHILMNKQQIMPMPVIIGATKYPENIGEKLNSLEKKHIQIDALGLAKKAGSEKCVNVIMIGALARLMGIKYDEIKEAIITSIPQRLVAMNITALDLGYSAS